MSFPMKLRLSATIAAFCLASAMCAQELPSAPSASRLQPPPQSQPAQQAPAQAPAPAKPDAQNPGNPGDDKKPADDETIATIVSNVNEVPVIFTVLDKHGHYVRDLKPADIQILDDNKPPQKISEFRAETDLPLRLGLLIDASNSIRERFTFEQQAAIEFLNQTIRPKHDQAFVMGFDTTPEISQEFTDNQDLLAKGVRYFRPGGGTALYDAVFYACKDKLAKASSKIGPVRRAIVLISDGEDNQSRYTRADAIAMAQRAEVMIYAISTNISGNTTKGDSVLKDMAEETGGRAFFPFKLEDLASRFTDIEKELRSQYFVSYRPADFVADGRFHSIQILAENKKYRIRARKGYYAPKQ
jgi:Ca-activated chloride channel family protein